MWTALDIFIGLALCYALISLFCTAIQEFLAQMFNARGKLLVEALKTVKLDGMINLMQPDLVNDPDRRFASLQFWKWGQAGTKTGAMEAQEKGAEAAAAQAATKSLTAPILPKDQTIKTEAAAKWRIPFDIPADVFARTLLTNFNLLVSGNLANDLATKVKKLNLPPSLETRLLTLAATNSATVDDAVAAVSQWYSNFMAQVEHWFTRRAQALSFIIGLVVALALNVDTVAIATALKDDANKRAAVVALAKEFNNGGQMEECQPDAQVPARETNLNKELAKLTNCQKALEKEYPFPIGWEGKDIWEKLASFWNELSLSKLVGILLSAIALSLGSRFWFDMLKSLLSLRTGGQPAEAKQK